MSQHRSFIRNDRRLLKKYHKVGVGRNHGDNLPPNLARIRGPKQQFSESELKHGTLLHFKNNVDEFMGLHPEDKGGSSCRLRSFGLH